MCEHQPPGRWPPLLGDCYSCRIAAQRERRARNPEPSTARRRGERVWTCDGCGRQSVWGPKWHQIEGCTSLRNRTAEGALPMVVCSRGCEGPALRDLARGTP